jgi:hypothetical protein
MSEAVAFPPPPPRAPSTHDHVQILGWIHLVTGGLGLMLGMATALLLAGIGATATDRDEALLFSGAALLAVVAVTVVCGTGFATGWGLLRRRPWARIAAIVLAVLHLAGFPFGTLMGAYALWALFDKRVAAEFDHAPA